MNKKADERMLYFYWIFIIVIITITIIISMISFYSKPHDIREFEAEILADKIINCVSNLGTVNQKKVETVFSSCNLYLKDNLFENPNQYYVEVELSDINNNIIISKKEGNEDFKELSKLKQENVKAIEKNTYLLNNGKKNYLKTIVVIRKTEKNT